MAALAAVFDSLDDIRTGLRLRVPDHKHTTMPAHLVERPTDDQIDAAVAVCTRAYAGDDALRTFVGGDAHLEDIFFRSMLRGAALEGYFYIADLNDGTSKSEVSSVGIVFPPGVSCWGSEAQRKLGYNEFWASLSPEAKVWWGKFQDDMGKRLNSIFGPKLKNQWVVSLIGTDPVHQNNGLGTSIIKAMCDRAGKTTVALSTQTEENEIWYESLGFKRIDERQITSPYGDWPSIILAKEDRNVRGHMRYTAQTTEFVFRTAQDTVSSPFIAYIAMPARLVRAPTDAQIDAAVNVCIRAFAGGESDSCLNLSAATDQTPEGAVRSFVGGDRGLEDIHFRSMLRAAALEGAFYIANDGADSSEVSSVGVVFPPGVSCWGSEAQRELGYND
ncbi:hypothetical protein EVG20_g8761 [Dentipellis fragilis]|uniref:N-acetyltransferase domain-containing protein n=1 Tax=Dentipellis fragilis TaxID=205917 RepID=A0A4Y9Y3C4_9AGAM|nr:hypothetical protein EVG20_g8761 [Dentipellis fragilis]